MITVFGVLALTFMMTMYAFENRGAAFVAAFAVGCALSSVYGFMSGAWPFGAVEAIWSVIAVRRYLEAAPTYQPHNVAIERPKMKIGITIDCPDPDHLAAFWEQILGYARRPGGAGGPYVTIDRPDGTDGPPHLTFQRVPEAKTTKTRTHLDLFVEHAAPIVAEMVAAGATSLTTTEAGDWTTRVLQDPAGNEFCVIGPD